MNPEEVLSRLRVECERNPGDSVRLTALAKTSRQVMLIAAEKKDRPSFSVALDQFAWAMERWPPKLLDLYSKQGLRDNIKLLEMAIYSREMAHKLISALDSYNRALSKDGPHSGSVIGRP